MNRWEYTWLIENRFPQWLQGQSWPVSVQHRDKCLWCDEPQRALEKIGVEIVSWQPKHSADLNAIENAWSFLRARLDQTHPGGETPETREDFVRRLRNAVTWVNKNRRAGLLSLSRNQKKRARDVLSQGGHRTEW